MTANKLLMFIVCFLCIYCVFVVVSGPGSSPPLLCWTSRQNLLHWTKLPTALPCISESRALLQPPQWTGGDTTHTAEASQSQALHGSSWLWVPRIPDLTFLSSHFRSLWPQVSLLSCPDNVNRPTPDPNNVNLTRSWFVRRVAPVLGTPTSSSSSSAPLSSGSSSFDPQTKPPPSWKELLKTSAPYGDNHHYYSTEYPCRYPGNAPGSPAALQTIITTTTKVRTTPVVDHWCDDQWKGSSDPRNVSDL